MLIADSYQMLSLCCSFLRFFLVLSQSIPKPWGWVYCYLHCILQGAEAERGHSSPEVLRLVKGRSRKSDFRTGPQSLTSSSVSPTSTYVQAPLPELHRDRLWLALTLHVVLRVGTWEACHRGTERAVQTLLDSLVHSSTIPELNSQNSHHWNGPFSYASKVCFLGEIWNSTSDTRTCRHPVT